MTDTGANTGTFGSGLSFGDGGGYTPTSPVPAAGADVPSAAAPTAPPDPGTLPPAASPAPSFGSALRSILPGPNYAAPDPQMSALDQTADTLQQRVQRANSIAANPMLQLFDPEGVAKARAFVPQAAEQLQKIKTQQAGIQAARTQADTLGLAPGEVPDEATQADRVAVAQSKALKGDLRVWKGLQAVDPKAAEAIQDQVFETAGSHVKTAQYAFDSLAGMQNQGQYAAKVKQLREDGTLTDLEALGMKIPPSFDSFSASKGKEAQALREAKIGIDTVRQKLEDRNTYQPMETKEADTYKGRVTTAYGDQITNGTWARNGASGTRGLVVNGAADPRELGKSFTLATPEQRKAIKEEVDGAVPKEDLEKFRAFNRTYDIATKDSKGNALPDGKLNTNPNVQQGVAEGLASMLRGGSGGANVGLLKIELAKRGWAQGAIDGLVSNYAGAVNTMFANANKPYLTETTQRQIRDVMDSLRAANNEMVGDRVTDVAKRAGALGLDAAALGFGKNESGNIGDALEEGRQAQIARMLPNHQAIGGGDGVLQLGAQRPGVGATTTPNGTGPVTQLPGAQPLQTPVQQAQNPRPAPPIPGGPGGNPPSPAVNQPPQSGGGQPVAVAGQSVNVPLPSGASPNFVASLQRIESGNERDPWKSGAQGSSASGAFQFINSTWNANKPAGAPSRAAEATPQQQAEALGNLTAKNATSLQKSGLEVNDTNLYIAHNVGAGGASALLRAAPNADARTVVGEEAARNNPLFFKGKPNVATVLGRYQAEMAKDIDASVPQPKVGNAASALPDVGAAPWNGATTPVGDHIASPEERANSPVVENAPAIGSTIGAVGGALAGGPVGGPVGGGVGGGAGQAFKDWMQGREQDPKKIAKQAALGTVLGIAGPEARPVVGALARVGGAAGVDAGATALEGGDAGDIASSAAEGGGYALGGEMLGRFVSSAGATAYKALSRYTNTAQKELSAHAGQLSEARQVLDTEKPTLPGDAGPNPKYEAAKKSADEATAAIKDHGQNPDDMVHAYEQAKGPTPVSSGEAMVMRPAASERSSVSQGYNDLRRDVQDAGVGAPKPNQAVPDGPLAQIRTADNPTGKVPEQFRPEAEHAEMLIKAPAKNWGEKWGQLQNAGTELIQKRLSFLANADRPSADAMDQLFQGVRKQQAAAAEYVFGPERGAKVIANLEQLDTRYAKVMNATKGMDYGKMQSVLASGNTPERRELEKNFTEFAKGDPTAIRAFNAMKAGARGDWKSEAALMGPVIAGEVAANLHGVPTVGLISAAVGAHRLYKMMQGYMNARVLGKAVTFKDFLASEIKKSGPGILPGALQRGATMQ